MKVAYTKEFEAFWRAYPRKKGKKCAFDSWQRLLREGHSVEEMIHGAKCEAIDQAGTEHRFIPHASTWLNQIRFDDYTDRVLPVYREHTAEERWHWDRSQYAHRPRPTEGKACFPPDKQAIQARHMN